LFVVCYDTHVDIEALVAKHGSRALLSCFDYRALISTKYSCLQITLSRMFYLDDIFIGISKYYMTAGSIGEMIVLRIKETIERFVGKYWNIAQVFCYQDWIP